jgi:hypothetical protein
MAEYMEITPYCIEMLARGDAPNYISIAIIEAYHGPYGLSRNIISNPI